jgi:hypothetical protein
VARVTITITISKETSKIDAIELQNMLDWINTNVTKKLPKDTSLEVNMNVRP